MAYKIIIGIPTYNEANNIRPLVTKIANTLKHMAVSSNDIALANADSASEDDTVKIFCALDIPYKTYSLINKERGKGRNVWSLIQLASEEDAALILIDGDIQSFDVDWLVKMFGALSEGADFVVPSYARKSIEGNTTNHFAYPLLYALFGEVAPKQPIAGDFGLSRSFITHLAAHKRPEYSLNYGIDIFLSLHAIAKAYRVVEIDLDRKIHNPSFHKMDAMFQEVCISAFRTIAQLDRSVFKHSSHAPKRQKLLEGASPIGSLELDALVKQYLNELRIGSNSDIVIDKGRLTSEDWATLLASAVNTIHTADIIKLTTALKPYFMLRTLTYLRDLQAKHVLPEQEIYNQSILIKDKIRNLSLMTTR